MMDLLTIWYWLVGVYCWLFTPLHFWQAIIWPYYAVHWGALP